jgi:hypothetical protein
MKKKIYKYSIESEKRQTLDCPKESEVLSVQIQNGVPVLWALVDAGPNDARIAKKEIHVYATGETIEESNLNYIGTFQMREGRLVFHVFEKV